MGKGIIPHLPQGVGKLVLDSLEELVGEDLFGGQRTNLGLTEPCVEDEELTEVREDAKLNVGEAGIGVGGVEELFHNSHFTLPEGNNPEIFVKG